MTDENRPPPTVLYISHGGGPLPLLGDETHTAMVETLKAIAVKLVKPSAIIVLSAHWEEEVPTITAGTAPPILYDYYGFPEQAYTIEYPAPGNPALAHQVHALLEKKGIVSRLDGQRGFDHGLYVPLKIMYPDADIPCIQVSLVAGLDPERHMYIGKALSGLEDEHLLVIGSGFSFHNMMAFFEPESADSRTMNEAFEAWLIKTCSDEKISEQERTDRLANWEQAPFARYCHPREEHLIPLHVCYGITQRACRNYYSLDILHKKASFYLW